jgi:transcriptional regulator with XRE-family HTH domain
MTSFEIKRRAAGLTQAQLAEAVGVTVQTVSLWEALEVVPHPANTIKLAEVLGMTAEELVRLFAERVGSAN